MRIVEGADGKAILRKIKHVAACWVYGRYMQRRGMPRLYHAVRSFSVTGGSSFCALHRLHIAVAGWGHFSSLNQFHIGMASRSNFSDIDNLHSAFSFCGSYNYLYLDASDPQSDWEILSDGRSFGQTDGNRAIG